jgi:hypothetical protein
VKNNLQPLLEEITMKQLTIDWLELELAFDNSSYEAHYYLDKETGEIYQVTDETRRELESVYEEYDDADDLDLRAVLAEMDMQDWMRETLLIADLVETHYGSRIIEIPAVDGRDAYEVMEAFIDTVSDPRIADLLARAIDGRGAFRRFKDTLLEFPQERERWFAFEQADTFARIREWLEEEEIEPLNNPPQTG